MEELFRDFWWLIFPIFGMGMSLWGMAHSERRSRTVVDLIKAYTDQGKAPPPELLHLAAKSLEDDEDAPSTPRSARQSNVWTFFLFAGLAAGFSVAYSFASPTEDWAWVFLAVAVTMAVMAAGALVMLMLGAKS